MNEEIIKIINEIRKYESELEDVANSVVTSHQKRATWLLSLIQRRIELLKILSKNEEA